MLKLKPRSDRSIKNIHTNGKISKIYTLQQDHQYADKWMVDFQRKFISKNIFHPILMGGIKKFQSIGISLNPDVQRIDGTFLSNLPESCS
jgi:hypothetical protein